MFGQPALFIILPFKSRSTTSLFPFARIKMAVSRIQARACSQTYKRKIEMRIKWMNVCIMRIFLIFFFLYFIGAVLIIISFKLCDDSLCVFTLPFTFHFFLIGYWKEVTTLVKIYILFIKKIFSYLSL